MNYYIDFDNTLYETAKLTNLMLEEIGKSISEITKIDIEELINESRNNFNSTTDNIFSFAEKMAKKYDVNTQIVLENVNNVILNGKDIVFEDGKRFIEKLKSIGHKIFILTYIPKGNQEYQMKKIMGSGISQYFDGIIITSDYKFNLDIKYENGIFIDDDPRDLNGLYEKNPIRVIRIRKPNNKRSKIEIDNKDIKEYDSFDNIEFF